MAGGGRPKETQDTQLQETVNEDTHPLEVLNIDTQPSGDEDRVGVSGWGTERWVSILRVKVAWNQFVLPIFGRLR
jgi:hypothetical protein